LLNGKIGMKNEKPKKGMNSGKKRKAKAIIIQEKWCKGCGICIEFCPGKVFSSQPGQLPVVARLGDCTVCRLCEMRCPDYAVSVEEVSGL
jgi:2-oxoglutarate ferredoxin oxidoreductase subunit delta